MGDLGGNKWGMLFSHYNCKSSKARAGCMCSALAYGSKDLVLPKAMQFIGLFITRIMRRQESKFRLEIFCISLK